MRRYFIVIVSFLLFANILSSCEKVNTGTYLDVFLAGLPLPKDDGLNKSITQNQWAALKLDEGSWGLSQCYKKRQGEWRPYEYIDIQYSFSGLDKVEVYTRVWSPQGDGGDWYKETVGWHYDEASSTITIGHDSYLVLYSGNDSFALLLYDVKITNPNSNTSCTYYQFCRQ